MSQTTLREAFRLADFDGAGLSDAVDGAVCRKIELDRVARQISLRAEFARPLSYTEKAGVERTIRRANERGVALRHAPERVFSHH